MSGIRALSYSEIETMQTCWARWDFSYGGALAGSTLKPRELAAPLQLGRAWGAAVAEWHAGGGDVNAGFRARKALSDSFTLSWQEQADLGFEQDHDAMLDQELRLQRILDHYIATATPLSNLTLIEQEIRVPLFSRTGVRPSNRYQFVAMIDGYTVDEHGHEWAVEFKLRNRLQDPRIIQRGNQPRWYAWALAHSNLDVFPVGIIVDERLNEEPLPPRVVNAKRKGEGINGKTVSHANQRCEPGAYVDLCEEFGVEPDPDLLDRLKNAIWQQRVPIMYRPSELLAAGGDITSAARVIQMLDAGHLAPVRNAKPLNCNYCKFEAICDNPHDELYVNTLFERTVPKRLREPEEKAA
jgi:hypothetical protein